MKRTLDTSAGVPQEVTAESFALADWYDAHPAVRRLWGIRESGLLRVVVFVPPTTDADADAIWRASRQAWARELHVMTGRVIRLELVGDCTIDDIGLDTASIVVADLYWRDATLVPPHVAD